MDRRVAYLLHFGTRLVWLVYPEARNVTVYNARRDHYVVGAHDELTGANVLPDFRCDVADFFKLPGH
jgi:Uma2 family endonuclease